MRRILLGASLACVALTGCESPQHREARIQAEVEAMFPPPSAEVLQSYSQPDFASGQRFFQVEDQHGCKWWIDSDGKWDGQWVVLGADGKAVCPEGAPVPSTEDY